MLTKSGAWSLNADQTVLTATYPRVGPAYSDDVMGLSASTLRLRGKNGGIVVENTYTAF